MTKAIIMAGGEGTRLRPLTCNRAKPMIPVINRPIIEHALNLLKEHNITDIIISLFYLPENIQNYFGDGSEWDVNITYSVEETPLGTAGGVKKAIGNVDDTFIILSGDGIIDFDITSIIKYHHEKKSSFTIVLTRVKEPTEYGIVITGENGQIEKFLEKPAWSEVFSDTANTGMYVLNADIMQKHVPDETKFDFSFDLFPRLREEGIPLYGYIADGYWCDVGNLNSYSDVHRDILDGLVKIAIPGKKIGRSIWAGRDVEISPEATIKGPVVIGNFVKIRAGAEVSEFSVIGDNCIIEEKASIRKSVVLHNTIIGPKSELRGAVIGKRCVLEQNVSIYEGTVVSDDCRIGADVDIQAGIRIWPDKSIEQGTRIVEDIIWGQTEKKTLFGSSGITGSFNIKITPEFAAKLGAAIGAYLGKNGIVVLSRDTTSAARIIKRAFTAGLLSMGVDVYDLEIESIPLNRYATRFVNADMGVYIQIAPLTELQFIQIRMFDKFGYSISLAAEKKIETIFYRGDFPRKNAFETGKLFYSTHHVDSYIQNIRFYLDDYPVKKKEQKIIADCFNGTAAHIFPELLTEYGCETMVLRGHIKEFLNEEEAKSDIRTAIKNIVKMASMNREIGVIIGPHGMQITIVDELGNILTNEDIIAILCLYYLKYRKTKIINIPVTASMTIENLIRNNGGEAIKTSSKLRSPDNITDIFLSGPEGRFPYIEIGYDAMFVFLRVLQYLSLEDVPLYQIKALLPKGNIIKTAITCNTIEKAAVMGRLTSELSPDKIELIDGIRINEDDGWVLVLPAAVQPIIHLYAEGETIEARDRILDNYTIMIKKYLNALKVIS